MTPQQLDKNIQAIHRFTKYGMENNWVKALEDEDSYIREIAKEKLK